MRHCAVLLLWLVGVQLATSFQQSHVAHHATRRQLQPQSPAQPSESESYRHRHRYLHSLRSSLAEPTSPANREGASEESDGVTVASE